MFVFSCVGECCWRESCVCFGFGLVWFLPKSPKSLTPSDPSVLFLFWFAEQTRRDLTSSVCARDVPSSPRSFLPPSLLLVEQPNQAARLLRRTERAEPRSVRVQKPAPPPPPTNLFTRALRMSVSFGIPSAPKVPKVRREATPLNKKPLNKKPLTHTRPHHKDHKQTPKMQKK